MENNITILIVEDEAIIANHLSQMLGKNGFQTLVALDMTEAYDQLEKEVDLVLLDMNIETRTSGLTLGERLQKGYHIPFIYLTANDEPALMHKALETNPAAYLTKPFNELGVLASVRLAIQKPKETSEEVSLQDGSEMIRFKEAELMYAITEGNYLKIATVNRSYLVRNTMDNLVHKLDETRFFRTHRTALVNLTFVKSHTADTVILGDTSLPLARNRKRNFTDQIS